MVGQTVLAALARGRRHATPVVLVNQAGQVNVVSGAG